MARAIKFRAWQPHTSLHRNPGMYLVESLHFEPDQEGHGEAFLKELPGDIAKSSEYLDDINLMQYTGFKDHTGAEIYEKDVIRFTNPKPKKNNKRPVIDMVVGWKANRGCWGLFWRGPDGDLFWASLGKQLDDNHQVVGNAYETPELVK